MQVVVKALPDLTSEEYRTCKMLSFRENGDMYYDIAERRSDPNAHAVMIKDGDRLIGWALAYKQTKRARKFHAKFYVRYSERKKGHGTTLLNEIKKFDAKPLVYPHDARSGAFFKKHRSTIRPVYGVNWLNREY